MTRALLFTLMFLGVSLNSSAGVVPGETGFATLLDQHSRGQAARTPWVGFWWPYADGGISSPQFDRGISPADKYDYAYRAHLIARGADLSLYEALASWEHDNHGASLPGLQAWWGHDLGWAAASILYPEPTKEIIAGTMPFGIHDIKALMSEAAMDVQTEQKAVDLSPNQFFLMLTNYLGKGARSFIIDRNAGAESWNVPLAGYAIDYPSARDYLGAHQQYRGIYRIKLSARVWWATSNVSPAILTPRFDMAALYNRFDDPFFPGAKYDFELWLDAPVTFDAMGRVVTAGKVVQIEYGSRVIGGTWTVPKDSAQRDFARPGDAIVPVGLAATNKQRNPRLDIAWFTETFIKPQTPKPQNSRRLAR